MNKEPEVVVMVGNSGYVVIAERNWKVINALQEGTDHDDNLMQHYRETGMYQCNGRYPGLRTKDGSALYYRVVGLSNPQPADKVYLQAFLEEGEPVPHKTLVQDEKVESLAQEEEK